MKKVLFLFGGNSYEHDISCKSINFIIQNIDKSINYSIVGIDKNNDWFLINANKIDENWKNNNVLKIDNIISFIKSFDIVFPLIHGYSGEDGKLQSLFELCNVKYVGCDSVSSLICYDKLLTKLFLEKYNIPVTPYYFDNYSYPLIIKPCKCGSSIGISVVNNKKELKKALKKAYKYDNHILIEKYIKNKKELECAVLEYKDKLIISDVGEIISEDWYDYDSKYLKDTKTVISNIDINIKKEIQNYSKKIFELLNCKSLSRIDFIYDLDNKKLYFNEINTIPGFTNISMYPKLMENIGISNTDLINILLNI